MIASWESVATSRLVVSSTFFQDTENIVEMKVGDLESLGNNKRGKCDYSYEVSRYLPTLTESIFYSMIDDQGVKQFNLTMDPRWNTLTSC